MLQDEVTFYGHHNVRSMHAKTIEITRDEDLSLRGDCIVGVCASKGCSDLDERVKQKLKSNESFVKIEIIVDNELFALTGRGDERLTLQNPHDIVIRKTHFVCPRTMSVMCSKASNDIPRQMVRLLQDSRAKGIFRISVE